MAAVNYLSVCVLLEVSGPVWAVVSMVPVNYLSVCVLLEVSGPVWAVV